MANTSTFFKTIPEDSRTYSRTLVHEHVPITGSLISGAYNKVAATGDSFYGRSENIKTFNHGLHHSIYDYPHESSSANHLFDISFGIAPTVPSVSPATHGTLFQGGYINSTELLNLKVTASNLVEAQKFKRSYNQMAMALAGFDANGNIRLLDSDGNYATEGDKILDPIFLSFSRLLVKDEIKKGSFSMNFGVDATNSDQGQFARMIEIHDRGADSDYKVNSPAGEYGKLYASEVVGSPIAAGLAYGSLPNQASVGLIYYQAGIVVLEGSRICMGYPPLGQGQISDDGEYAAGRRGLAGFRGILDGEAPRFKAPSFGADKGWSDIFLSGNVDSCSDFIRSRISKISFNNTTEINSATYFCRAQHNEFNYSSNATYLNGSEIRVKDGQILEKPKSYVTTVGLYSADNELLAVAKVSEPLIKSPESELTLRVRLDY